MRFFSAPQDTRKVFGPKNTRHAISSAIISPDAKASPSDHLLNLSIDAIKTCRDLRLGIFDGRPECEPKWFETWPGEHYRLLAALVRLLKPRIVVEVGTFTGMGSLSLAQEIGEGHIHTFDVIPWNEIGKTWLVEDDFTAITQHIADLSDPAAFEKYSDLLREADLLFVDAPKDGRFEPAFLANLNRAQTKDGLLAVFDDIRTPNMLASWDQIDRPKLDLVSFGHWSGTGLVDWTK